MLICGKITRREPPRYAMTVAWERAVDRQITRIAVAVREDRIDDAEHEHTQLRTLVMCAETLFSPQQN